MRFDPPANRLPSASDLPANRVRRVLRGQRSDVFSVRESSLDLLEAWLIGADPVAGRRDALCRIADQGSTLGSAVAIGIER